MLTDACDNQHQPVRQASEFRRRTRSKAFATAASRACPYGSSSCISSIWFSSLSICVQKNNDVEDEEHDDDHDGPEDRLLRDRPFDPSCGIGVTPYTSPASCLVGMAFVIRLTTIVTTTQIIQLHSARYRFSAIGAALRIDRHVLQRARLVLHPHKHGNRCQRSRQQPQEPARLGRPLPQASPAPPCRTAAR